MAMRLSGMYSGLDTDTIIKELVKAKSTKVDKAKKQQTSLEWKQDAWKDLNAKLVKLFNGTISNMRWQTTYMKKSTKASNASAVSIITGESAVNGVQNMKINNLAKTGYLTGAQLSKDSTYTAMSKMSELDPDNFGSGQSGTFSITSGGKTTDITINGESTISDVLTKLKEAGVNASFDSANQRFFISAKESGVKNDFSITASDAAGEKALVALGINTSMADDAATLTRYEEYAKYYVAGDRSATLDNMRSLIDKTVANRAAAYAQDNETIAKTLEEYSKKIDDLKANSQYPQDGVTIEELDNQVKANEERIKELQAELKDMEDGDDKTAKTEELEALQKETAELSDKLALVKEVEDYEAKSQTLMERKAANDKYVDADGNATADLISEVEENYYAKAEYANDVMQRYEAGTLDAGRATRIAAEDAMITLNGATFESSTNVFEINGLTFTALEETDKEFTVTTANDTDGIYDTVKNFLKEYNAIIIEMDKLYNAESTKGYEPLTDEEKDAMSEKEIEKWEQKIKDSILRRDETVNSVASAMKGIMSAGVEINGKTMYLSDFGIDTLGYFNAPDNEKYAYHIDGDPDDTNTSGKADKLKGLIASDPELVSQFFSALSKNLYDKLSELSASSDYSSFNTFYDDKKMKADYTSYTTKISTLEKKLIEYEDKYYKKFAAMETALAKMQSNQNALAGLLGG